MSREGTPRKRRQWIKLWTAESLRGSIRFDLTPAERGVWYDLLAMAGESRTPGIIQATEGVAYPRPWLAQTLNIPLELLDQTLEKLGKTERVELNGDCIHIVNFEYYQARRVEEEPGGKGPDKYKRGMYGKIAQERTAQAMQEARDRGQLSESEG